MRRWIGVVAMTVAMAGCYDAATVEIALDPGTGEVDVVFRDLRTDGKHTAAETLAEGDPATAVLGLAELILPGEQTVLGVSLDVRGDALDGEARLHGDPAALGLARLADTWVWCPTFDVEGLTAVGGAPAGEGCWAFQGECPFTLVSHERIEPGSESLLPTWQGLLHGEPAPSE